MVNQTKDIIDLQNQEGICNFLKMFFPEGTAEEFTIWERDNKSSKHFKAGDDSSIREAAKYCASLANSTDVYFNIYPHIEGLTAFQRGKEENIKALTCFYADIDLETFGNKDKADKIKEASGLILPTNLETVLEIFDELGLPACSIIVHSGNGLHCYWMFENPLLISNEKDRIEAKQLCVSFCNIIVSHFKEKGYSVDQLKDLARVLRVPYTKNYKGDNVLPVELITNSGQKHSLSEMKKFIDDNSPKSFNQERTVKHQILPVASGKNTIPHGMRDNSLTSIAGSLRNKGLNEEAIFQAIDAINATSCNPPLDTDQVRKIARSISKYPSADSEYNLTDLGNAKRLVNLHCKNIRYCTDIGEWLAYDGKIWRQDNILIARYAKEVVGNLHVEAELLKRYNEDKAVKLKKFALQCESERKIKAMIELAKSESEIELKSDELNNDIWLLNCQNGTLDLKTGELLKHNPDNLITKIIPVDYNSKAECLIFDGFINDITGGNESIKRYVQKIIGYSLTGSTQEQSLFIMHGYGQNGKTTLIELIRALLGDYARQAEMSTLLYSKNEKMSNGIARLKGARFVTASEVEQEARLAESVIKQLTGGDTITARHLYKEHFEFNSTFKIFLAVNRLPEVKGTDEGIWRRLKLIPFNQYIPPDKRDTELLNKLKQELSGVLNWALKGCAKWQNDGLEMPDEVKSATKEYRDESDILGQFINDCCKLEANAETTLADLYESYSFWCDSNKERILGKGEFSKQIKAKGYEPIRIGKSGARGYRGMKLIKDNRSCF